MKALDSWWLDVKLGVRMLFKYPGLALAGGAGIAVAVAIAAGGFSVIYDNFLTSSVPLEEGDRLVSLELWDSASSKPEPRVLRDYRIWRDELKSVQEIGAFRILAATLIAPGVQPESIRVAAMTASGFRAARVRPLMGRTLEDDDERPHAPSVVVIGENVWRSRFAGDPAILGRMIQLGATPYAIAGVMPKNFAFPVNDHVWVPLREEGPAGVEPLTGPALMVFGRLAPGASLAAAQAELNAAGQRGALAFPAIYAPLRPQVMPYPQPFVGIHSSLDASGLVEMQGIFIALLVLVCLNVTILVYTRTATRQAEISLRTALGASRGRIVAQLFIEALVLSGLAALAGVAFAALGIRWVAAVTSPLASRLPFWVTFRISPGAVLYAVTLSVFAAAIVGILPALQATRRRLQTGLRIADAGMRLGKTWTVLIVAQVGFAVAILPPAVAAAWNDARDGFAGLGFAAQEFLSVQLAMDLEEEKGKAAVLARRQTELMRRVEAEPRVSGVTFSLSTPGDENVARIEAEGSSERRPPLRPGGGTTGARSETEIRLVHMNHVDIQFFRVFEVPILAGRGFTPADLVPPGIGPGRQNEERPEGGAVIVNLPFARKIFAGQALGRRIRYVDRASGNGQSRGRWYEIVGIVPDFPTGASPGMRDAEQLKVYHAAAAGQLQPAAIAIRLRGAGGPAAFAPRLREIAAAIDPEIQLSEIQSLDEVMRSEQWISRLTAASFAAITLSVLLLSSAGIYALMSFTVSQRRKEIGIRMALGAHWNQIVASIFSRALLQLAAGAALGAALGVALERASGGVLLRGNASTVVPLVALVVSAVGLLAALGPTRRSLRIKPIEALREQ